MYCSLLLFLFATPLRVIYWGVFQAPAPLTRSHRCLLCNWYVVRTEAVRNSLLTVMTTGT